MTDENDNGARMATAAALSDEVGLDMSIELLRATDKFLVALYMRGFVVVPIPDDDDVDLPHETHRLMS